MKTLEESRASKRAPLRSARHVNWTNMHHILNMDCTVLVCTKLLSIIHNTPTFPELYRNCCKRGMCKVLSRKRIMESHQCSSSRAGFPEESNN